MHNVNPTWVLFGSIGMLIILLHDKVRFVAALVVALVAVVAAAQLCGLDLAFWK